MRLVLAVLAVSLLAASCTAQGPSRRASLAAYGAELDSLLLGNQLLERSGRLERGDGASRFRAYSDTAGIRIILEQADLGDSGRSASQYLLRGSALLLYRESRLRPRAGAAGVLDTTRLSLAFDTAGTPVEHEVTVNGAAGTLAPSEAAGALARAAELLRATRAPAPARTLDLGPGAPVALTDSVTAGETVTWELAVQEGQTLGVRLDGDPAVLVAVSGFGGPLAPPGRRVEERAPVTGNYLLRVGAPGAPAGRPLSYTMTVQVR